MVASDAQSQQAKSASPSLKQRLVTLLCAIIPLPFSLCRKLTTADISFVVPATREPLDLKSYNVYHSANDTPFKVFENCVVDSDYEQLVIRPGNRHFDPDKKPIPSELVQSAWMSLYSDYLELADDGTNHGRLHQVAEINILGAKIEAVKMLCSHLLSMDAQYHDMLLQAIRESGFKYCKTVADIKRVIADMKRDEVVMQQAINNLPNDQEGNKPTRQGFDDILAGIGDVLKVVLVKENFTVSDYCAYYRRMMKMAERRARQQEMG